MTPKSPEGDLLQLIYVSSASRALAAGEVEAIGARSHENNRAAGLTGLLLHRGEVFYGVLEGPPRALLQRMEVIITDPRHGNVRVLREENIDARRFANWSFAALPQAASDHTDDGTSEAFIRSLTTRRS